MQYHPPRQEGLRLPHSKVGPDFLAYQGSRLHQVKQGWRSTMHFVVSRPRVCSTAGLKSKYTSIYIFMYINRQRCNQAVLKKTETRTWYHHYIITEGFAAALKRHGNGEGVCFLGCGAVSHAALSWLSLRQDHIFRNLKALSRLLVAFSFVVLGDRVCPTCWSQV